MSDNFKLKGKNILITGASKGLGSVCAKALSRQNTKLVLMARSKENLESVRNACKNSNQHLCIPVDLSDIKQLQNGVSCARKFLKNIDVILHVAGGGLGLRKNLINAEDFLKLFKLNIISASEINRLILPEMIKRGSGNIVHIGSIASMEATGSVGYNTVKAALASYVRSLGSKIAGTGVIVTGILPGGFLAPGNSWEQLKTNKPEVVDKFIKERLPRGFLGNSEELIPMILLLCSGAASMMAGCMVPIDAGEGKAYVNL